MKAYLSNFINITKGLTFFHKSATIVISRNFSERADTHDSHDLAKANQRQKSLNIAVIGVPNAGKSTFINNIISHRVCPTSRKVHTTRRSNKAIYTRKDTQLVFLDTPGLVTQTEIDKHHLEKAFKSGYRHAIQSADLIAVVHDISNSWTRNKLHPTVVDTLKQYKSLPRFLVLNKIDTMKSKRILLELVRNLSGGIDDGSAKGPKKIVDDSKVELKKVSHKDSFHFEEIFMVSSLNNDGLNSVHDYLTRRALKRPWEYTSETFTDDTPEELIVENVRACFLDFLPQEIPYNLRTEIEFFSDNKNVVYASVQVTCPTARIERLICGESDGKLRQMTERATSDLVQTFGKPVSLTIVTTTNSKKENAKSAAQH